MMHYEVKGEGEILFFIHGWGYDSRVWRNQSEVFSDRYCVVTADLKGYGKSKWQAADNLLDAFAADTLGLCIELNLKKINFVSWSLGCYIIFKLFELAPEIMDSVVLVGGTPKFLKGDDFKFGFEEKNLRIMRRRLNRDSDSALLDFRRSIFLENEVKNADFSNLWEMLNLNPTPNKDALISSLDILERADFRDEIKRFNMPALIICGEGDSITPKEASEYMHNAIKNSSLVVMKDAGHAPFLTKPIEFNGILEKWLKRNP